MTLSERQIFAKHFLARRTSRIVSAQNGFEDVMSTMQFDAGAYNGDTQEEANSNPTAATTDTTKVDVVSQGEVPREGSDEAWQTDVANALEHINRAIENVGVNRSVDDGTLAGLNILASTMQALRELPSGVSIAKAVANADGQTREPLFVNDNVASSHAGPQGYIPTSELQKMQGEAAQLTKITSRVVAVTAL
jgi:hypothetical protein